MYKVLEIKIKDGIYQYSTLNPFDGREQSLKTSDKWIAITNFPYFPVKGVSEKKMESYLERCELSFYNAIDNVLSQKGKVVNGRWRWNKELLKHGYRPCEVY